jgi:hypothetical protein
MVFGVLYLCHQDKLRCKGEGYEESEERATALSSPRSFFMACYGLQMAGERLFKAIPYARLRLRFARNSALLEVLDICWSSASMASSPRCSLKFESMRRIVTTARYVCSS